MKHTGIPIKGFTVSKDGAIKKRQRKQSVSERIRQRSSKRVRPAKKGSLA